MSLACFFGFFIYFALHITAEDQLSNPSANLNTLVHLQIVWRHGEQNPGTLMPNDKNNGPETWPGGLGELTKLGTEQSYHLGEVLRHRYGDFLPTEHSGSGLYVRSSDRNGTLMSAQMVLAGMFPRQSTNDSHQVNLIPVHTVSFEEDRALNSRISCPSAEEEERTVYEGPVYRDMEKKYANILDLMGEEAGLGNFPLPFKDVWRVYDSLYPEFNHQDGHKLPAWVDRAVMWQISQAYELSVYGLYDSDKLKRLRAGPIVGEVMDRIQQKIDGTLSSQKLYAYSGHDTSIASFLLGLGIKPVVFPLHSTALMIELHKDSNVNDYILRLFFRNDTQSDDVYELDIPDCPRPCSFDRINRKLRETLIPKNWQAECNLIPNDTNGFPYLLFIFVLVGLAIILAIAIVCLQLYQITIASLRDKAANCNV